MVSCIYIFHHGTLRFEGNKYIIIIIYKDRKANIWVREITVVDIISNVRKNAVVLSHQRPQI